MSAFKAIYDRDDVMATFKGTYDRCGGPFAIKWFCGQKLVCFCLAYFVDDETGKTHEVQFYGFYRRDDFLLAGAADNGWFGDAVWHLYMALIDNNEEMLRTLAYECECEETGWDPDDTEWYGESVNGTDEVSWLNMYDIIMGIKRPKGWDWAEKVAERDERCARSTSWRSSPTPTGR